MAERLIQLTSGDRHEVPTEGGRTLDGRLLGNATHIAVLQIGR